MSRPDPVVSVVLPTYNLAQLLPRAMQSVLDQSFRELELIVVDDGSTDATVDVVQAFQDPRVRLVRLPENRGVGPARNAGIAVARAPYIAFQDHDDLWLPEKL